MTLLYFSATGNSLYVAKQLASSFSKNGDDVKLVSITQELKNAYFEYTDDKIGIIFPTYGLAVPNIVTDFLKKSIFNTPYLFAVATFANFAGGINAHLEYIMKDKKKQFDYIAHLAMPSNYFFLFDLEKQKDDEILEKSNIDLDTIKKDILDSKHFVKKHSFIASYITKSHVKNNKYKEDIGITNKIILMPTCTGCSTCTKVCPTGNITIKDNKPIFAKHCISCLACTSLCPTGSIKVKGEKSKGRYHNKHVSLEELINANRDI